MMIPDAYHLLRLGPTELTRAMTGCGLTVIVMVLQSVLQSSLAAPPPAFGALAVPILERLWALRETCLSAASARLESV